MDMNKARSAVVAVLAQDEYWDAADEQLLTVDPDGSFCYGGTFGSDYGIVSQIGGASNPDSAWWAVAFEEDDPEIPEFPWDVVLVRLPDGTADPGTKVRIVCRDK